MNSYCSDPLPWRGSQLNANGDKTSDKIINEFEYCDNPEWYATVTISWGELREWGFIDWDDDSWTWNAYSDEQKHRLIEKMDGRFWQREIGIMPPGDWKRRFLAKLNEIQPKYNLLYKQLEYSPDPLADSSERYKRRHIFSDFPATMLGGDNQDYASTGDDEESERIVDGNITDNARNFKTNYQDVDAMMLDELDVCFSSLLTVAVAGW